jgi:hypothetical protein
MQYVCILSTHSVTLLADSYSIASRLKEAQNTAAMLTTFQEVYHAHKYLILLSIQTLTSPTHVKSNTGRYGQPHGPAKQVQGRL